MSIFSGGQGSVHPAVIQALIAALGGLPTPGQAASDVHSNFIQSHGSESYRPADMQHALGNDHEAAALWFQHHPGAMNGHARGVPGYVGGQGKNIPDLGGDANAARQKILQILMQRRLASPGPEQPQMGPQRGPFPRGGGGNVPGPNLNY